MSDSPSVPRCLWKISQSIFGCLWKCQNSPGISEFFESVKILQVSLGVFGKCLIPQVSPGVFERSLKASFGVFGRSLRASLGVFGCLWVSLEDLLDHIWVTLEMYFFWVKFQMKKYWELKNCTKRKEEFITCEITEVFSLFSHGCCSAGKVI